jgi:hypothetical protein
VAGDHQRTSLTLKHHKRSIHTENAVSFNCLFLWQRVNSWVEVNCGLLFLKSHCIFDLRFSPLFSIHASSTLFMIATFINLEVKFRETARLSDTTEREQWSWRDKSWREINEVWRRKQSEVCLKIESFGIHNWIGGEFDWSVRDCAAVHCHLLNVSWVLNSQQFLKVPNSWFKTQFGSLESSVSSLVSFN